ncbi:hypothetical protein EV175_003115 [Coemansia sp. RSA 1933]|nr:hypothetical protein EV175_003115 [Coemansia sp. RSA 1933]
MSTTTTDSGSPGDPVPRDDVSRRDTKCNGNGFCLFKHNPKMHIIWSSILGSLIVFTILLIVIQHKRKRKVVRPQKAYVYDVLDELRLSEPLPRYSPERSDHQPITHDDVYRMHREMLEIRRPEAAALKPEASCSPPPYIRPSLYVETSEVGSLLQQICLDE